MKRRMTIFGTGMAIVAPAAVGAQVYLREADAARAIFPESTSAVRKVMELTDAELESLSRVLGRRVEVRSYPYLEVRSAAGDAGDIFILEVIGQSLPITFAIGVGPDGALKDVQVMVYREPHGDEIENERFRRQFAGKRLQDPVALGKDIDAISGATISSASATYAARKGLALADLLRKRAAPRTKP